MVPDETSRQISTCACITPHVRSMGLTFEAALKYVHSKVGGWMDVVYQGALYSLTVFGPAKP